MATALTNRCRTQTLPSMGYRRPSLSKCISLSFVFTKAICDKKAEESLMNSASFSDNINQSLVLFRQYISKLFQTSN